MSTEPTSLEAKKEALSRQTEIYKQAIGDQVSILKDNAGQATKRALIIGAGLAASYFLVRAVTKKKTKKNFKQIGQRKGQKLLGSGSQHHSGNTAVGYNPAPYQPAAKESGISNLITQQIAIFLIGIATQKLQEYFDNSRKKNTEPISRDDKAYIEPIYIK
jgi:hypothetical protein